MNQFENYYRPIDFHTKKITEIINGLSREQLMFRPYDKVNCPIWILGHITICRLFIANTITASRTVALYENEEKLFAKGSQPVQAHEYPDAGLILKHLAERGETVKQTLAAATPEQLSRERKAAFAFGGTSVQDGTHFLLWHEAAHYGELAYLNNMIRRLAE